MSQRSRENRYREPGARTARPNREVRRLERQAERRAEHQALHDALDGDLDEFVVPARRHGGHDKTPVPADDRVASRRRFRVWKTKMWKRRSGQRRERARAEQQLRDRD